MARVWHAIWTREDRKVEIGSPNITGKNERLCFWQKKRYRKRKLKIEKKGM